MAIGHTQAMNDLNKRFAAMTLQEVGCPEIRRQSTTRRLQQAGRKRNGNSNKSILRTASILSTSPSPCHSFDAHLGHTLTKKRARRKRSLAQTILFSPQFVRKDATKYLDQTWRQTLSTWESLLRKTIIPPEVPLANLDLSTAVNALNDAISGRGDEFLASGFGYVQLSRFLGALEGRVKADREAGLIPAIRGRVNSSLVIDMYLEAQGKCPTTPSTRSKIWEYKRIGGRWEELVGQSIFLLAIYSDVAETFVKDHSQTDNATFKVLASAVLGSVPENLLRVCLHLSVAVEERVRSGLACDDSWMDEIENHVGQHMSN